MNIFTAETDWISIVIFVIAGITSLMKYMKLRNSNTQTPDFPEMEIEWEDEEVNHDLPQTNIEHALQEKTETEIQTQHPANDQMVKEPDEGPNNNSESVDFNLRQAMIHNVILNRPEL